MDEEEDDEVSQRGGTGNAMPSLLKGTQGKSSSVFGGNKSQKGVTPFMKKKENVEDKARINELSVFLHPF